MQQSTSETTATDSWSSMQEALEACTSISIPQQTKEQFDHFIFDTEGFIFGAGGSRQHPASHAVYTEIAIVGIRTPTAPTAPPTLKLLYHEPIRYHVGRSLRSLGPEYASRGWSTFRWAYKCSGCETSGLGVDVREALSSIKEIIAYSPKATVWAKGPAMEERFLAGYADTTVSLKGVDIPRLRDLTQIDCPHFEDLPPIAREYGWSFISQQHLKVYHPHSDPPHCCAAECLAFAKWFIARP